jgi:hypothetical protein
MGGSFAASGDALLGFGGIDRALHRSREHGDGPLAALADEFALPAR